MHQLHPPWPSRCTVVHDSYGWGRGEMERTLQNFMVMLVFWDFVPGTSDPTSCLSWMREGAGAWWCKYSLEVECTEFCFCLWALSDKCFLVIILASAASPPALKVYCRPRQLWLGSGGDGAYFTKSILGRNLVKGSQSLSRKSWLNIWARVSMPCTEREGVRESRWMLNWCVGPGMCNVLFRCTYSGPALACSSYLRNHFLARSLEPTN